MKKHGAVFITAKAAPSRLAVHRQAARRRRWALLLGGAMLAALAAIAAPKLAANVHFKPLTLSASFGASPDLISLTHGPDRHLQTRLSTWRVQRSA